MLLTEEQAAWQLGVSVALLRKWRQQGQPRPVWVRVGRLVRYPAEELKAYVKAMPSASSKDK